MQTINCKGNLINVSHPKVMGILNLTPDSFFDGGRYKTDRQIVSQVEKMLHEGATFIDVGGVSSKPYAKQISEREELKRIVPVIALLTKKFPDIVICVDTFRSRVAKEAIAAGACLINDIYSGDGDAKMFETLANLQVPYISMHMQGCPQNMQDKPHYKNVVKEVYEYLSKKHYTLKHMGINDVIFDVGFGFGKTLQHNYTLLQNLDFFKHLNAPILVGLSRKSMIYKTLNNTPQKALNGTSAAHTIALLKGAHILRVHDVKQAIECIEIVQQVV